MAPQDSFVEEEEDSCPLCIEELDLSDRNFRPCPCGYQVCQFCFNNIKNNMNGLCPACRRPYDEKSIQWKVVTTEEVAEFRANIQKSQKKRAQDQKQKEVQKREAEKENRKNLIGVRVVQKNLVYITGLAPTVREDELLKTLRKPEFFGQYGNIQKISISNRRSSDGQHQSLGIYVTFEKPDEATRCIQAVHGSQNGDRTLKAQHGTTKYCSAWLKNEKCSNPGCMFLHEQGDDEDSYTRQDLSSMNSINTQRPLPAGGATSRSVSRQQSFQPTPPLAFQSMARSSSKDDSENGDDSSALPSSANWARNPQRSRRGSHATSGATSSPAISASVPLTTEPVPKAVEAEEDSTDRHASDTSSQLRIFADGSLRALLKAMQGCSLPPMNNPPDDLMNPPMFDIRGGEKRKAMREDEDARPDGEQEHQPELQELSEGEPETGGSLALGGEPEERDGGETHSYGLRRQGTQPPIQRSGADGIFGPALGGLTFNPGSVNAGGRALTPQQLFLRSQGASGDQLPPGIPSPNSGFQNQGHNRQSSRFSFANDNTSAATNVKLSANPRIMAQQSSMMPNSYQGQTGNQFYGTSMPGPPPGLKSTGTPPSMFGQGFGGSGYGAIAKDAPNELLQSLIGRNRGGNSQSRDVGKREYMISSFLNQYPPSSSTSTPAPASGLLASLYGTQPGAIQDFGSKQKKKGKKHRHANTSSSGGSGLVDLADPSILQARMQHQSQSNAGAGQGLFNGQSQDDELRFDEATLSVDALVSDDPDTKQRPKSESTTQLSVAPPGLAPPHAHPIAAPRSSSSSEQKISFTKDDDSRVPQAQRVGPIARSATPETLEPPPRKTAMPSSDMRKNIKALAVESGLSREITSHAHPQPLKANTLQDEDFPALDAPKSTPVDRVASPAVTKMPVPKSTAAMRKQAEKPAEPLQEKTIESPKEAAVPVAKKTGRKASTNASAKGAPAKAGRAPASVEKSATESVAAHPPVLSPSATSVASPAPRAAPKTLRVVATPKSEIASPASPAPTVASVAQSVASRAVSTSQRLDTSSSEMASDTASIASASVSASRAGSPPPSRVGTAAVRTTTKSQQRKQRKETFKEDSTVIAESAKQAAETHAAVVGRKKKQKKEKPVKVTESRTKNELRERLKPLPSASRVATEEMDNDSKSDSESESEPEDIPKRVEPAQSKRVVSSRGKGTGVIYTEKSTAANAAQPEHAAAADDQVTIPDKPQHGPQSIFGDIKPSLWTSVYEKLQMLKPATSSIPRLEHGRHNAAGSKADSCNRSPCKCGEIQEDDLAALRAGKPVRKQFHVDGSRMLITPNGDCVRGLSSEEEDIFLELQSAIAAAAEHPGAFVAPRHQPGNGAFSLIKGRAVPNGRPNIFPTTVQPQSQDPIGKLQREDALSYINQYVLPRLNLGSTNMGLPKGASPTPDAAAASLNSLAPYFYGPDAAAGVGIYSSPDGARAIQDIGPPAAQGGGEGGKCSLSSGMSVGGISLMSVEEAEAALGTARKETDKLEKGLNSVIKRNRRLLLGGGN